MKYLRLKRKKDFSKIVKSGKRIYAPSLTIVIFPAKQTKMAVCVGKKYGKSVERNRIKRLLREAFRTQEGEIVSPCHILLIPKVAEKYEYGVFWRDIGKLLRRKKLLETQNA